MSYQFTPYRRITLLKSQRIGWKITSEGNHKIIASSSEGFWDEYGARENARLVLSALQQTIGAETQR